MTGAATWPAADPCQVLWQAARLAKPGGMVCSQEVDNWYTWAYPETVIAPAMIGAWARTPQPGTH
jgi:hypothetical protein